MIRNLLIFCTFFSFMSLAMISSAAACSCRDFNVANVINNNHIIIEGKITEINKNKKLVKVKTSKVLKNTIDSTLTKAYTEFHLSFEQWFDSSCSAAEHFNGFKVGDELIITPEIVDVKIRAGKMQELKTKMEVMGCEFVTGSISEKYSYFGLSILAELFE